MNHLNYNEALELLDHKLDEIYETHGFDKKDMTRQEILYKRESIELSLDDKQTLKEHFRDITHSLDATGDQSKVSLFYGGGDIEGAMRNQIAPLQKDFRNITDTEVGKFMTKGHKSFTVQDFYKSVFGNDVFDPQIQKAMLNFRNEQWIPASENYAKATEGKAIFAVGENAKLSDIMYNTEYKAIEEVKAVDTINGVSFDDTYRSRPDEIKLNQMKVDTYAKKLIDKENFLSVSDEEVKITFSQDNPYTESLGDFQKELYAKTHIAKAEGLSYDEMFSKNMMEQDEIIQNFYEKTDDVSKNTLTHIDEYKNMAKVGKYGILGAVGLSFVPKQAEASSLSKTHFFTDISKYETLSQTEQIGAEIGAGFNAINAIQAGEEFRTGASKSASTLLDTNAYKQGLAQATDVWKPSLTKEVTTLGAMDSAKVAGKSFLKKLPLIGLGAGIAFGIGRAMDGDWKGAGMEVASGAMSLVPGWGTAGSVVMDAALLEKDTGLLTHGADKLLHKEEEQETFVQSEDNHVTKEPTQNITFSKNLDQEVVEQRVDLQHNHILSQTEIEDRQSTKIDTTEKAQEIIGMLYPHLQNNHTPTQQRDETTEEVSSSQLDTHKTEQRDFDEGYNNTEEESYAFSPKLNAYLDQFKASDTVIDEYDMGMEID